MILQEAKIIVENILKELNKTEVSGYTYCSPSTTYTVIRNSQVTDSGEFNFELYTSELKFGGIDDEDHNDSIMEQNLIQSFSKILKKGKYKLKPSFQGQEKGYWDIYLESSDPKSKIILNKRKKIRDKITKYQSELRLFNDKVKDRILNQKSKKKTCSNCESNINIKYFRSHKCPLCGNEMYTDTDKKRVSNLNDRISKREKELKELSLV